MDRIRKEEQNELIVSKEMRWVEGCEKRGGWECCKERGRRNVDSRQQ